MKTAALLMILSLTPQVSWSFTDPVEGLKKKISCPQASKDKVFLNKGYLAENKLYQVTKNQEESFLYQFLREFQKFPQELHKKMVHEGATVHLIQGTGVTDDPYWIEPEEDKTFDGRDWNTLPGTGGFPFLNSEEDYPTRIVINNLYDKHGSINLVLHEHAHSLDSIYSYHGISTSPEWAALIKDNEQIIKRICGSYCSDNAEEAFAELMAYYYACDKSRAEVEREVPMIAQFLRNLPSFLDKVPTFYVPKAFHFPQI